MSLLNISEEALRQNELNKYNILDTLTEQDYEDITFLAAVICGVPIALISFVDEERQWFKSHRGISISETLLEYSFCAHAINSPDEIMIVQDSRIDPRFKNNPLVTGEPNIVFYAGVPLVNELGFGLGTVCVIDTKERTLSDDQVKALKILSDRVIHLLQLRKIKNTLEGLKQQLEIKNKELEQFAMVVSHDIKSPLTSVLFVNDLIESDFGKELGAEGAALIKISNNAVIKIKSLVDGILSYYTTGENAVGHTAINLASFLETIRQATAHKNYILRHTCDNNVIYFNNVQLEQIFLNLVNNSIRYNDNEIPEIDITFKDTGTHYRFTFTDNGIGIAEENYEKVFSLFSTIADKDNTGVKGSGIGLSTVKKIIENAGGTIELTSKLTEGTTFIFTLGKTRNT